MRIKEFKIGGNVFDAPTIESRIKSGFEPSCWVGQQIQVEENLEVIKDLRVAHRDLYFKVYITTLTGKEYTLKSE